MRSPRRTLIEQIRKLNIADDEDRYHNLGCRVRVYRRGANGLAEACEYLNGGEAFGGVYDSLNDEIVSPLCEEDLVEVSIHEGQVPLLSAIGGDIRRIMGLGSPGGGKTVGIIKVAQVLCVAMPNSIGGVVAPTQDRLRICWKKFLEFVEPLGWITKDGIRLGDREIHLKNGTKVEFRSAKKQSAATGSPIAGHDWHWAVEDEQQHIDDEALREVDARGRVNPRYQVFSSATNESLHQFQMRVQEYEANAEKSVIRFSGPQNCWTSLEHWEALKRNWSADDYDRIVNCKDIPREGRVYPQFQYKESTAQLPDAGSDFTSKITEKHFRQPFQYVVGCDPGVICHASVIMKCFGNSYDHRWFILDEVTTRDSGTEWHTRDLRKWFEDRNVELDTVLVLGDPAVNKEADRSDFLALRNGGFIHARPSNGGQEIPRRHRFAMVNALLRDANMKRHLFLVASPAGPPKASKTAESLGHLMYTANGDPDMKHKTAANIAHWSDAAGYGLFPFEKMRGNASVRIIQGNN